MTRLFLACALACTVAAPAMASPLDLERDQVLHVSAPDQALDATVRPASDHASDVVEVLEHQHLTGPGWRVLLSSTVTTTAHLAKWRPTVATTDPFAEADALLFASQLAVTETYTPTTGDPVEVQVIWERGVQLDVPGRETRVIDNTLRAHLLVSEVGRPQRDATLTDGEDTRRVMSIESDDKSVVVVKLV